MILCTPGSAGSDGAQHLASSTASHTFSSIFTLISISTVLPLVSRHGQQNVHFASGLASGVIQPPPDGAFLVVAVVNSELHEKTGIAHPRSILPPGAQVTSHVGCRRLVSPRDLEPHSSWRASPFGTNSDVLYRSWKGPIAVRESAMTGSSATCVSA